MQVFNVLESGIFRYRPVSWLKNITNSGASFAHTVAERRNVVLTNSLSLVSSIAVLLLLLFRHIFESPLESAREWLYVGALLFLVPILLNRMRYIQLSRLAMCWIPSLFLLAVSYYVFLVDQVTVVTYIGMRYYLLAFCCPPFLLFSVPRERMFMLGLLVPVFSIVMFDPIFNLLGVGYVDQIPGDYAFNNVRAVVSLFVISCACYILKSRADRNEDLNTGLISELALKNKEIQKQASDRVHKLNRELYQRLQQLTEREFILNQSQRIARIGSWDYTIQGEKLFCSDEMYNIFGINKSVDVQANNIGEVIGGDAGKSVITATTHLLKTNEPFDITFRIRTPLGYTKWLRMSAFPVTEKGMTLGARGICHDITYYKEAEELLRASDKKYRSLFEQASDAIIITDFDGNFTDANSSFCKMFGYSLEELLHMNISQAMDPDEVMRRPIMFGVLAQGIHIFNERRMVCKDGSIRDVEANVKKLDEGRVVAIIRDVTELRKAQKQIQLSEATFRGAFEHSAIGMTIVSPEGQWKQVNREFSNIVGYTEEELLGGMRFRDITHPDDLDKNMNLFDEAVRGERDTYRMEKRYVHKNGNTIWVRINVSMVRDDRNRAVYCVAQIEDVTHDIVANEKLMISQANLQATINNATVMIWSIDKNYNLLTFNHPFSRYMKEVYGAEPRIGQRLLGDPSNEDHKGMIVKWKEFYQRTFAGEAVQVEETRHGQDFQYSLSPIKEGDQIIGISIVAENVTNRKAHDRELAEANKKIEELKLMALRSVMSPHFIFNVLNSIQFFIAKNDRLNAINYLSTFSKLIRSILNHSVTNSVKLGEEVEMLKNYVHLEMTRFEEKFGFVMEVEATLDMDNVEIPSLLIQPYVENAILHGLYNRKSPGTLTIRIKEGPDSVVFEIEDNGVGRAEAMRVRQQNFPTHKSMGIRLTEERLKLIKRQNNAAFEIEDLVDETGALGTRVRISIPY